MPARPSKPRRRRSHPAQRPTSASAGLARDPALRPAATFLPFASGLVGEYPGLLPSQCLYAAAMAGMALTALWQLRHLRLHPELCHSPIPAGVRKATEMRIFGLLGTVVLAVLIAMLDPRFATMAFMLMAVISPWSARVERRTPG